MQNIQNQWSKNSKNFFGSSHSSIRMWYFVLKHYRNKYGSISLLLTTPFSVWLDVFAIAESSTLLLILTGPITMRNHFHKMKMKIDYFYLLIKIEF